MEAGMKNGDSNGKERDTSELLEETKDPGK